MGKNLIKTPIKIAVKANPGYGQRCIGKPGRSLYTRCTPESYSTQYAGQSVWRSGGYCTFEQLLPLNKCYTSALYIVKSKPSDNFKFLYRYCPMYASFAEYIQELSYRVGPASQVITEGEGVSTVSVMRKINQYGCE